jgi:hypothetical protein
MTTRMENGILYVGCTIKEMRERSRWTLKWRFVLLLLVEGSKTSSCSRLSFTVHGARADRRNSGLYKWDRCMKNKTIFHVARFHTVGRRCGRGAGRGENRT